MRPTTLIAEDEPLLAEAMVRLLGHVWPEAQVVEVVGNGIAASTRALQVHPDVLFLDIRMPGQNGLEVAAEVVDDWPAELAPPLIVFATAYDEFAVHAFEHAAVDFILKPVSEERLKKTVERLRRRLNERSGPAAAGDLEHLLQRVQGLSLSPPDQPRGRLDLLHIGLGDTVRMVKVADVLFFEATDKYVNVVTRTGEGLIRMSMRELAQRLAPDAFMQVHRSVMVNRLAIESASRNELGHVTLKLAGITRMVPVSRAFAHHFRPM